MLSQEILSKIRHIQLKAGSLATEALAGEYLSAFKGRGMEFDDIREYMPGDDVRWIDWNVTARMGRPFVKEFREEREVSVLLLVDVSPSQRFGSGTCSKQERAAEFAAVIAYLAIRNNDRVGLILFSDHVEKWIPPMKGRGHVWRMIREVLSYEGQGQKTDMAAAVQQAMLLRGGRCLSFVISDFLLPDYEQPLLQLKARHDPVCVEITDPLEQKLPNIGLVQLQGLEDEELLILDTCSWSDKKAYETQALLKHQELMAFCRRQGLDGFSISTQEDYIKKLMGFLKSRERRRYR